MYVGSQMSEKELQRIQKIMAGGQITPEEKKRLTAQIEKLKAGSQISEAEFQRIKNYKSKR